MRGVEAKRPGPALTRRARPLVTGRGGTVAAWLAGLRPGENGAMASVALALATLYVVWGSTYLAIKLAVAAFPPDLMLALRFGAASLLLGAALKARGVPWPSGRQLLGSAAVGLLLLVGGLGSVATAESLGAPSGLAAVMVATMPLWLTFFVAFLGERPRVTEVLAMLLGVAGAALLGRGGALGGDRTAFWLLLLGPMSWAFGSAASRRLPHAEGGMGSAVQMGAAALVLLALGLARGERIAQPPGAIGIAALAYLVVFGSLLAFSAYVFLLDRRVRPSLMTSYVYANPVIALLLGAGLAGERPTPVALLGTGIIVASVVLVVSRRGAH